MQDADFMWTDDCDAAMKTLKQCLVQAPILTNFDPELPSEVYVDASEKASGAALIQRKGNEKRIVEYGSKKIPASDEKKHSTKLEQLPYIRQLPKGFTPTSKVSHTSMCSPTSGQSCIS